LFETERYGVSSIRYETEIARSSPGWFGYAPWTFAVSHPFSTAADEGWVFPFSAFRLLQSFLFLPPIDLLNSVHPIESNAALPSRIEAVAAPSHEKRKSQNHPPFANTDEGWGTLKVHCKNECHCKTTTNHRSVNYRSGIIAPAMESIVGITAAKALGHPPLSTTIVVRPRAFANSSAVVF
jgi:hypothetical protein